MLLHIVSKENCISSLVQLFYAETNEFSWFVESAHVRQQRGVAADSTEADQELQGDPEVVAPPLIRH